MKKLNNTPKYILSLLFICICFIKFACVPCRSLPTDEVKEAIYVYVFFGFPPLGETLFVKNVHLHFSDITGLPVNMISSAFNDGFISAKAEIIRAGRNSILSFSVYYNLSQIVTEKANEYADNVANEFLEALGYKGLDSISRAQNIDNTTNIISLFRQFGFMNYTVNEITPFMKYKPEAGFGRYIDSFLARYVPGTDIIGIVDLYYNVKKTGSTFSWEFVIGGSTGKYVSDEMAEETIDLDEILNNSLPIQTPTQQSAIFVDVEKNQSKVVGGSIITYTLNIKDTQPAGYIIIDEPTTERRKYEDLTTPLNNVIVKVDVGKTDDEPADKLNDYSILLTVAVVSVIIAIAIIIYAKKRRSRKTIREERYLANSSLFFFPCIMYMKLGCII